MRRLLFVALALAACSNSDPVDRPDPPTPVTQTVVNFSTYLGNDLADSVRDIALDAAGNLYATGWARSANLLPGSPVRAFGGEEDAFVAKLDTSGAVLWWTFLGGTGPDRSYAIDLDGNGDVVIGGSAAAGFPVTPGALLTQFQGGAGACDPNQLPTSTTPTPPTGSACDPDTTNPARDGFVAKLSGATGALSWATYFGSGRFVADVYDEPLDAAITVDDNVTDFNDDQDPRTSVVRDVAADPATNAIYLTFAVTSPNEEEPDNRPATTNTTADDLGPKISNLPAVITAALQNGAYSQPPTLNALPGGPDGMLAKLAPDGASLEWATFVGGTDSEATVGLVKVDAQGNPVVLFPSQSFLRAVVESPPVIDPDPDTPTHTDYVVTDSDDVATAGTLGEDGPQGLDILVSKFAADGTPLWATFVGGNGSELLESANFALRTDGSVVIAIRTDSTAGFVGAPGSGFDTNFNGIADSGYYSADCGIFLLSPTGTQRDAATYYGGGRGDACTGVAVDTSNRIYVAGGTHSQDLPLQASPDDPYQTTKPGTRSGFLAVFSDDLDLLHYGSYFGGSGLGNVNALIVRQLVAGGAQVVFGGDAGAGYPLTPAPGTPARGTVTAPPEHGAVTDATLRF